ncbi:hypothetical protein B566_EDAN014033, partial [Ephemera danica]
MFTVEVLQTTDPQYLDPHVIPGPSTSSAMFANNPAAPAAQQSNTMDQPYVVMLEQPAPKALRFRYECEGRSAGSIPGVNSTPENKTYPTIKVMNYQGRAVVVVSCVTKDVPYRPHPHNLVGKDGFKRGVCTLEINPDNMTCVFSNLGIQCVKKKDIEEALKVREEIRVDPYRTGFSHRSQPTSIDLNAVRLAFQVFLENPNEPGKFKRPLPPIVSDPIYDKKAMSDLVICRLSDVSCYASGGKEIILLCEKVAKEDISIRFYEEKDGQLEWEGMADFQPTDVHKQVAIGFRTPAYKDLQITKEVDVKIQLRRPSDNATSEPKSFKYLPLDSGRPFWSLKKLKANYGIFSSILAANTALMTTPHTVNGTEEAGPSDAMVAISESQEAPEVHEPEPEPSLQQYEYIAEPISQEPAPVESPQLDEGEKSLNELLSQVAELEEIYPEPSADPELTECLKQSAATVPENAPMDVDDVYESGHYTSLQMAMKNPILIDIDFEDTPGPPISDEPQAPMVPPHAEEIPKAEPIPTPQLVDSNKRESSTDKLPPLPPKRCRKNTKDDGTEERNSLNAEEPTPQLPPRAPIIETTPPKQKSNKPNFFQKLFSRKGKSKKQSIPKSGSVPCNLSEVLTPEDVPPSPTMDLTEAEHLALYTDVAPRANVSEFDEMSFYYSPVEGHIEKPLPPEPVNEEKRNS